ncbi:hypothetical protein R75461_01152 [Paraburkholderia nemoris]|nr:hypothetical protein R75461_01152 [Paraburkholderia nemoris]
MFSTLGNERPNRCEKCRHAVTEKRAQPDYPRCNSDAYTPGGSYPQPYIQVDVLVCKRMPPTPNKDGNGMSPVVLKGDYCGEFESAD